MNYLLILVLILFCLLSCNQNDSENVTQGTETTGLETTNTPADTSTPETSHTSRCSYDSEVINLGMGLVLAPTTFEIFNDSLLTNKLATRDMHSENEDSFKDMCTKVFLPEYGIMHFVCIRETALAYQVLINYSDVKYLPRKKGYEFQTWAEYILGSMGVRRLTLDEEEGIDPDAGPLRKHPKDDSDSLLIPDGFEMFCPMEVRGDWVKVKYDCFYNQQQDIEGESYNQNHYEGESCQIYISKCKDHLVGWLRWRKDNKLLIDIMLIP